MAFDDGWRTSGAVSLVLLETEDISCKLRMYSPDFPIADCRHSFRGNYVLKKRLRLLSLLMLLSLCSILLGCSVPYEKQVVVHCDANRTSAGPILASFARQFPKDEFQVQRRSLLSTDSLVFAESARNSLSETLDGDVVWDSDLLRTIRRQRDGLLLSRKWAIPRNWPNSFRASDGTWVAFAARARVLIINVQSNESTNIPKSVFNLAMPQWKDRCGIASLSSPSVRVHLSIIASCSEAIRIDMHENQKIASENQILDFDKWMDEVIHNVKIYETDEQLASAVVRGEIQWGVVDSDLAIALRDQTSAIKIVFPDQGEGGFGAVLVPDTVSVLAANKNPKVAGRLADFLVSDEVEARLTISDNATIPLNPVPKELSRLLRGLDVKWADIEVGNIATAWDSRVGKYAKSFRFKGQE